MNSLVPLLRAAGLLAAVAVLPLITSVGDESGKRAMTPGELAALNRDLPLAGDEVPGFGGAFLAPDDESIANVYMLDASDEEGAWRALRVVMGGRVDEIRDLVILQGDYALADLDRWYQVGMDAVWQVPGVVFTDLDEGRNRINIGVLDEAAADRVREAWLAEGLPPGALIIEVTEPVVAF